MKKRREARTAAGVLLTHCPGCGGWPVHQTWLEQCRCGLDTCRLCREAGTCTVCTTVPVVATPATEPGTPTEASGCLPRLDEEGT